MWFFGLNLYLNSYGQAYVDKFVAKPGYSEHQTGLTLDIGIDLNYGNSKFENTKEFEEKGILKKGETFNREIVYSFSANKK